MFFHYFILLINVNLKIIKHFNQYCEGSHINYPDVKFDGTSNSKKLMVSDY